MNYSKTAKFTLRLTLFRGASAIFLALGAFALAGRANAQYFSPISHATVDGNQSEVVCSVSLGTDGKYIENVVYNDMSPSPKMVFSADHRDIYPGASITGRSFREKSAANPDPTWTHDLLSPPTSWDVLWGDTSIATNPARQDIVFIATLGIPHTKFTRLDQEQHNGTETGKITSPLPEYVFGGGCIYRSLDSGKTFPSAACVQDTTNAGAKWNDAGHIYDGSSMAVAQCNQGIDHDCGDSGLSAYVGYVDTETNREAVFRMKDVTAAMSNDANPFQSDHTVMGTIGPTTPTFEDTLGAVDTHLRLVAEGTHLWKMTIGYNPADPSCLWILKANIRDAVGNAVQLACNPLFGLAFADLGKDAHGDEITFRTRSPNFAFDIGDNEHKDGNGNPAPQREMRFVYISGDDGHLHAGYCPVAYTVMNGEEIPVLSGCQIVQAWNTSRHPVTQQDLFPAIKFATDPVTNTSGWKVTFQGRPLPDEDLNQNKVAIYAADLVRPDLVTSSPTIDNNQLVLTRVTEPQQPCPFMVPAGVAGGGYWGDYDGMTFDPVTGAFVRSYTDSSRGCQTPRNITATKHMHASTVYIPLRPTTWNIARNSPFAAFEFNDLQEQVKYANGYGHICELYFTKNMPVPGWQFHDLTDSTTPPVALVSGIAGFVSTFDSPNQQHVLYKSSASDEQDLQEFVYANGWQRPPNDLTSKSGAPAPAAGKPLAGYETAWNQQLHVDFIDGDGYVHDLWYDRNAASPQWTDDNLWNKSGPHQGQRANAVNLVGYATTYNSQHHVVYVGDDQEIYEYVYDTSWQLNKLTSGGPARKGSPLIGYETTWTIPQQEHIDFIGNSQHVYELVLSKGQTSTQWQRNDLNNASCQSGTPASASSGLTGYQTSNSEQHVDFVDKNNRVQELVSGNDVPNCGYGTANWKMNTLTDLATDIDAMKVPAVASGSHLAGYETSGWDYLQHVIYTTVNNEVYELFYYGGHWYGNNLTKHALLP